jgi:uncharacterized protein
VRVWIDLSNSPHVFVMQPVIELLEAKGHIVVITARDHAQTVDLAVAALAPRHVEVIGSESPGGRIAKGRAVGNRALRLRRWLSNQAVDVAVSHGSYAQLAAAKSRRVPSVTLMDYEYQPANHLSFRLASRVVVPSFFPTRELRRAGAREAKVVRYDGFKEDLYLAAQVQADRGEAARHLRLDPELVVGVFRPPPEGALYHRHGNVRFDELVEQAARSDVRVVVLPRLRDQDKPFRGVKHVIVPESPVNGVSLLSRADFFVGAGGTMSREAAILGTPAYTVFSGKLAAVDQELIHRGWLVDLRQGTSSIRFERKVEFPERSVATRGEANVALIVDTVLEAGATV